MLMYPHMHRFKLESRISNNHKHKMLGYTDNMIGINSFHMHYYYGITSYNGHTHYYSGLTGLPVKTENGHIHKIEGVVEFNNMHDHKYADYTNEDIEYIPGKKTKEAYI